MPTTRFLQVEERSSDTEHRPCIVTLMITTWPRCDWDPSTVPVNGNGLSKYDEVAFDRSF
ncbi:MAG: hypothetical protein IPJ46_24740 [Anaerolineales bacterium]|nr:hypothetical protein [Anaerolineales bacterium]